MRLRISFFILADWYSPARAGLFQTELKYKNVFSILYYIMSKNNLKSSQKQSVVVKIGDTTYKRRRPKRKIGIKKIVPIINTGPFVTGILATPSTYPGSGSASTFQNISPFQPRNIIAADPRIPIQPIDQPEAYDRLFPGPGRLLNRRPREFDLESNISDVTDASSYSIFPEDFRSVASQVSESRRGLEMIEIPQRGMGSSINPPSIEEIRKTQLTPQQQMDLLYSQQFVNPTFNNNRFSSEENFRNYESGNPSTILDRRLSRKEGFNLSPNFPIPDPGQPLFQDSVNGSIDFK